MVVIGKKKFEAGEATQYLSRKQALKKLQLSLNEFRRLCILKGIYPREPRNRKKAQKGDTRIKILYYKKDIQFLMHEPLIWKVRDYKVFARKVSRAKAMREFREMKYYLRNHPTLTLDHIVKERYPTFMDALKDLDDCLTLCFLFSTFPSMPHIPRDQSALCRRLTIEFLHAIIAAKALRKVFISIKGYYYQAEIKGQTITWIVPHNFCFEPQKKSEVDFKLMSIFVEFYIIMLGFINYRLFHTLNLFYPPKFNNLSISKKALVDEEVFVSDRIAALNISLVNLNPGIQIDEEEEFEMDSFSNETNIDTIEKIKMEQNKIKKLKTLFKGMKFYLNREVPREPLVFIIRCFGGEVSWNNLLFAGSTFDENDETITHHLVDRPSMNKQFISRHYVQPQWIFDSVNARELLPVEKYFIGCQLPPHLSPFLDLWRDQVYIPPEERALIDPDYNINDKINEINNKKQNNDNDGSDKELNNQIIANKNKKSKSGKIKNNENMTKISVVKSKQEKEKKEDKKKKYENDNMLVDNAEVNKMDAKIVIEGKDIERLHKKKKMKVKSGEVVQVDPWERARQEKQEYRLREKLVRNKYRNLYKSMVKAREERAKDIWLLRKKRHIYEEIEKTKRSEARKAECKTDTKASVSSHL